MKVDSIRVDEGSIREERLNLSDSDESDIISEEGIVEVGTRRLGVIVEGAEFESSSKDRS